MKTAFQAALACLLLLLPAAAARAQQRHDPLSDKETDQLRDVSPDPDAKLKLYVKFARARMDAIEKVRADSKLTPQERGRQLHDLLEDLGDLVDEVDRNLESFAKRHLDMRKALVEVVAMNEDFQSRLGALQQAAADPALAEEAKEYKYELEDTLDSVKESAALAADLLQEQKEAAERAKHKKQ